jgi:MFS family permease
MSGAEVAHLQASAEAAKDERRGAHPPWSRTIVVLGLMAGCFAFQETSVLPILPTIQRGLAGANTASVALLESGYLIIAGIAAPLLGKLGDCHGKKRMLLATLGFYFIGAVGAGFAPDFIALILFRAVQGVGGALLVLSIAISRDEAPSEKLSLAIGWIIGGFGVGACLGLGLSGIITELLSWRYIFFVEGALILTGAALIFTLIPGSEGRCDDHVDYVGLGLLGGALAALIMGITEVLLLGWPDVALFVFSAVLFTIWIYRENHTDAPLLEVKVLASPSVLLPNIGSALAGYAAFSTFFLVPRFVQVPLHLPAHIASQLHYGFGADAVAVGLYSLPIGVGVLCAGPGSSAIARRVGGKWTFAGGLAMIALASGLLAFFHGDKFAFAVWLFLLGAGFGLSNGAASVFVTEAVEQHVTGIANGFLVVMRLISGGIGAQIAALLVLSQSIQGGQAPRATTFMLAFGISAMLALIGAGIALLVPNGKPNQEARQ